VEEMLETDEIIADKCLMHLINLSQQDLKAQKKFAGAIGARVRKSRAFLNWTD
jgi:hypothetical protein